MALWTPLPPGDHVLYDTIVVPSGSSVDLRGVRLHFPPGDVIPCLLDIVGAGVEVFGGEFDGGVYGFPAWREHYHAMRVRGAANVHLHDNLFYNLSGDGILVYENAYNVTIQNNRFSGANTNRNGISVVWAQGVYIMGNTLYGMTRYGMPGPIDIEPDEPHQHCVDITVYDNEIVGTGDPVQAAVNVYNQIAHAHIANITISGNTIRGRFQKAVLIPGDGDYGEQGITVRGNKLGKHAGKVVVTNASAVVKNND